MTTDLQSTAFSKSNIDAVASPFESKEGDYCYMVNNRWPILGWSPRRQYCGGKWRFAWFGRPHLLVCTNPILTEKAWGLFNDMPFVDENANPVECPYAAKEGLQHRQECKGGNPCACIEKDPVFVETLTFDEFKRIYPATHDHT